MGLFTRTIQEEAESLKVCHTCGCAIGKGYEQIINTSEYDDYNHYLWNGIWYFCKVHRVPYDRVREFHFGRPNYYKEIKVNEDGTPYKTSNKKPKKRKAKL